MKRIFLPLTGIIAASPALAHLDPAHNGSFAAGLSHPVFGLDHVLAMVLVGLWAAMLGGRALWMLPACFVGVMIAGYAGAVFGIALPMVEPLIGLSVIALGLLVALAQPAPLALAAPLVGGFALFHGHAHGGELGAAGMLEFGAGFALSTAVLHGAGIGLATLARRALAGQRALRGLGLVAAAGGALALAS